MSKGQDHVHWAAIIQEKMRELELIASWASMVHLGSVRDNCRIAVSELKHELSRFEVNT